MNSPYCLFKTEKKRVVWEITHLCNYQCVHCCSRSGQVQVDQELTYSEIIRVLDELKEEGVQEIYYSGGEPFTRSDMVNILTETRKRRILANVSTNGSFLTLSMAEKLKEIDVNLIHISLDSDEEDKYNMFRGGDYYRETVEAICNAKKAGLYVRVGAVIWRDNAQRLQEMIEFLISHQVDEVVFNWLIKAGRFKDNSELGISLDEFDHLIHQVCSFKQLYKEQIKVSMHRSEAYRHDGSRCQAGKQLLFILPDGKISGCSWLAKLNEAFITEDTLKNRSITELKKEEVFEHWNQILDRRCITCHSGCPAICFERTGNYFSEDPLLITE